jgi:hypothetical protein
MKIFVLFSLGLSLLSSSAFAEGINSIRKLPNGDNQIIYSLSTLDLGPTSLFTLTDNDGMATLETVQLMLIQDVSTQLWYQKASWNKVGQKKVENWELVKEMDKDALGKLSKVLESHPGELQQATADLAQKMIPYFEQGQIPTYSDLNLIGQFIDSNKDQFSYPVNGEHQNLASGSSEDPVGAALTFRPMTLPPQMMSTAISGSHLNFDIKAISAGY